MVEDSSCPPADDDTGGEGHTVEIGADERPSEVVIRTVAAVTNRQPLELEPLHAAVDPDALDALFAVRSDGSRNSGRFTFRFNGCKVCVQGETVFVRELD